MSDRPAPSAVRPRRHGRRIVLAALTLVLLVGAVWSALWFLVAHRVEAGIDKAIEREARVGRVLTCRSRHITGFPFAVSLDCVSPRLAAVRPGGTLVAAAARLTATARVTSPNRVLAELAGPLSLEAPGSLSAEATWRSFRADITNSAGAFDHGTIAVERPELHLRDGQAMYAASADRLDIDARPDTSRPAQDDALKVTASLDRIVSQFLDDLIGNTAPGRVAIDISISRAGSLRPSAQAPPFEPIERWRQAGGAVHIASASGVKGDFKVGVTGDVEIDDVHRPEGRINASIAGAQKLVAHLPLPGMAGSFLKMSAGGLKLPLVMRKGRVVIGPFAVAKLEPLY